MTRLLEQVLEKVRKLPAAEQDAIASLILSELKDEQKWDRAFAASQPALSRIAKKVRRDIRAGKVSDQEIDDL